MTSSRNGQEELRLPVLVSYWYYGTVCTVVSYDAGGEVRTSCSRQRALVQLLSEGEDRRIVIFTGSHFKDKTPSRSLRSDETNGTHLR